MTDPALPIAVAFIAAREGFRSHPYRDQGGTWTIGYGFTVTEDGQHVTADTPPITQEAAYARLGTLVARVLVLVRGMVHVPITDNQAAALTSFAYNLGTNAVRTSTLLRLLNGGDIMNAANQFGAWVYCDGQVDQGLVNRRMLEQALFLTAPAQTDQEKIPAISAASNVEAPRSGSLDQETTADGVTSVRIENPQNSASFQGIDGSKSPASVRSDASLSETTADDLNAAELTTLAKE